MMPSTSPTILSHCRRRRYDKCTLMFLLWGLSVTFHAATAWMAKPPMTSLRTTNALRVAQDSRDCWQSKPPTSTMLASLERCTNTALYLTATSSPFLNYRNDTASGAMNTIEPMAPASRTPRQQKQPPLPPPPSHVHILVLPGFGTDSEAYLREHSLIPNLYKRGWREEQVHVLQVARYDWFFHTILQGMILNHRKFMTRQITPMSSCYKWYLQRISEHVNDIATADPNAKIVVVGHSAGGWLARAAVGYGSEAYQKEENEETAKNGSNRNRNSENSNNDRIGIDIDRILGIVTLGSPHLPLPNTRRKMKMIPDESIMDITGGALRDTNTKFPGAYFRDKMFYITAVGNAVEASATTDLSSPSHVVQTTASLTTSTAIHSTAGIDVARVSSHTKTPTTTNNAKAIDYQSVARIKQMAYHSYKLVSGDGKARGDGVVPMHYAHLDGALQINLDHVYHAAEISPTHCSPTWYGSDTIIDQWMDSVMSLLPTRTNERTNQNVI